MCSHSVGLVAAIRIRVDMVLFFSFFPFAVHHKTKKRYTHNPWQFRIARSHIGVEFLFVLLFKYSTHIHVKVNWTHISIHWLQPTSFTTSIIFGRLIQIQAQWMTNSEYLKRNTNTNTFNETKNIMIIIIKAPAENQQTAQLTVFNTANISVTISFSFWSNLFLLVF